VGFHCGYVFVVYAEFEWLSTLQSKVAGWYGRADATHGTSAADRSHPFIRPRHLHPRGQSLGPKLWKQPRVGLGPWAYGRLLGGSIVAERPDPQ
jgi:hypothetical protein